MPRPGLDPRIISLIEDTWVEMKEPSGADVHRKILQLEGNIVGVRKVQTVIADAKNRREEERRKNGIQKSELPWQPWQSDTESAEEIDYLLELRRLGEIFDVGVFTDTQAWWAKKIRISLKSMPHLMVHYVVSTLYDGRYNLSLLKGRLGMFFTDDLDQYLAYKPWLSESRRADYEKGLLTGKLKYPVPLFLGNSFEHLPIESRLQSVRIFGLPERLAQVSINDITQDSEKNSENIDFLFRYVGLVGEKQTFISYMNNLINFVLGSDDKVRNVPGFGE